MFISRRKFLSWIGVAGLTSAVGCKAKAATNQYFKGHPDSLAVLHDTIMCLGCRRCEDSCNKVNSLPKPKNVFTDLSVLREKRRTTPTEYTVVNQYDKVVSTGDNNYIYYYKKQCNHCLEPACASACFVNALKKTKEGPVIYDSSVCVGCRYCMVACPFEIPTYEYEEPISPRVMKCTMCYDRIIDGKLPGCVKDCPSGALMFGKRRDLLELAKDRISNNKDVYLNHIYGEREMGGTSWLYLAGTSFENIGLRMDLGFLPASEFTAPALGAVPIIVGLWPVFLTGIYAMNSRKDIISTEEKFEAVRDAVDRCKNNSDAKMVEAMKKAEDNKIIAVKLAVKKALEEVEISKTVDMAEIEIKENSQNDKEDT